MFVFENTLTPDNEEELAKWFLERDSRFKEYYDDALTSIGHAAFSHLLGLQKAAFPKARWLESYSFANCASLEELYLPELKATGVHCFENCSTLAAISLPKISSLGGGAFENCVRLEKVDFGENFTHMSNFFKGCSSLSILILRSPTVVVLESTSCLDGTPLGMDGIGGRVFVPGKLLENYNKDTNWAMLKAGGTVSFQQIEWSDYE